MQLLAAFEAQLRNGAKDEAEWSRLRSHLYAPPRDESSPPGPAGRRRGVGLTADAAEAMIARMAAADAAYGR